MAFNFPNAPEEGATFHAPNGLRYVYNSPRWRIASLENGGIWTGDAPPPGVWMDGMLWWESDSGKLFVYYEDTDSSQWVEMVGTGSGGGEGGVGGPVAWDDVTGKPATFPPTVPIAWADISGEPATYPPDVHTHSYSSLTGIPATFTPSAHAHPQSDITNLTTDLGLKYDKTGGVVTGNVVVSSATPAFQLETTSGTQFASVLFRRGTSTRWTVGKDATAEVSNTGADFRIARHNDTGTQIDQPIFIPRGTGIVQMALGATTLAPAAGDNSSRVATTAYADAAANASTALTVLKAGDTMTGKLTLPAAATEASLNVGFGVTPSTPVQGDIWIASAALTYRDSTTTRVVVNTASNQTVAGVKTFSSSPVLPTPTAGDNTTNGATTAFVTTAIAAKITNKITVASSAPGSPATNDVWIDTT